MFNKKKLILALAATTLPFAQSGWAEEPAQQDRAFSGLEETVVTARKRTESLQDTPISITAFSAKGLEMRGIDDVSQIEFFTPNLVFDTASPLSGSKSSASMYIRGIGQSDFSIVTDPGVGLYLDGVYIARSIGSVLDVAEVERIEVLRGPQGTLFGRNTIGGAISVITKKPGDEFSGYVSAKVGSYDRFNFQGSVDVPIVEDKLLSQFSIARFSGGDHIDRPILGDEAGGDDSWGGRAAFLYMPSDSLEVNLNFDATKIREESCCSELVAVNEAGFFAAANNGYALGPGGPPQLDPSDPAYFGVSDLPTSEFQDNTDYKLPSDLDIWGTSLTIEKQFENGMSFKSITAYRDMDTLLDRNNTHSAQVQFGKTGGVLTQDQFSQEFQLQGAAVDDRLQWIVGAYYFQEDAEHINDVDFRPVVYIISGGIADNSSIAAFTQLTYDVTENLSITGGLRYTEDEKEFDPSGHQYVIESGIGLPPGFLLVPEDVRTTKSEETLPMINVAYNWSDEFMTYVTYSEGFKGGGFSQNVFPPLPELPSFNPEYAKVWEAGFKYTGFDNRVRLNGAIFQTDYEDLQVTVIELLAPVIRNAAEAEIRGFELELLAVPTESLTLEVGVGYLDSEYLDLDPTAVVAGLSLDKDMVNAPEWSLNASVSYAINIDGMGVLIPRIDWSYKSDYANEALNDPNLNQDAFTLINASIAFEGFDDRWLFILAGTNLTDERYKVTGFADLPTQSIAEASFGRPREWSLTARYSF